MNGPRWGGLGAVRAPPRAGGRVLELRDALPVRAPAGRDERRALDPDDELRDRDDVGVLVPMVLEPNCDVRRARAETRRLPRPMWTLDAMPQRQRAQSSVGDDAAH